MADNENIPLAIVSFGNYIGYLQPNGLWKYQPIQKAGDHVPLKKGTIKYQDKADVPVVEELETEWKNQYKNRLHKMVMEIGKFLKDKL